MKMFFLYSFERPNDGVVIERLGFGAEDGRLKSGWASRRLEILLCEPNSKWVPIFSNQGRIHCKAAKEMDGSASHILYPRYHGTVPIAPTATRLLEIFTLF